MKPFDIPSYLSQPDDFYVVVVGAGGNGSHFIKEFASMNYMAKMFDYGNFEVHVYDDDYIEEHNIGRQHFADPNVGQSKAVVTCSRMNVTYGFYYKAHIRRFEPSEIQALSHTKKVIIVLAVDDAQYRIDVYKQLIRLPMRDITLIDMGNSNNYGQVVFAPTVKMLDTDVINDYLSILANNKKAVSKSCSHIESVRTQGLFVNRFIALTAANLFWNFYMYNPEYVDLITYLQTKSLSATAVSLPVKYTQKCISPLI